MHDDSLAQDVLWQRTYEKVAVVDGYFNVMLADGVAEVFAKQDEVWLEVQVGEEPPIGPRTKIGSLPFALRSKDSNAVGGTPASTVAGGLVPVGTILPF